MKPKNIIVFVLSFFFFLLISGHRFGDSGHALALISQNGGRSLHPVHLQKKYQHFSVIVTARVLPPYQGDTRVVLEGIPDNDYDLYFSEPIIDLGITKRPAFKDNTFYGLEPGSRIAMRVRIKKEEEKKETSKTEEEQKKCHLAFYDTKTGRSVLKVPILFENKKGEGEVKNEDCH